MDDNWIAPDRFETDTFVIRAYAPGDGVLLSEAVNTSYEHLSPFMEWAQPHQDEATSERLAREFCGRYLLAEDFVLGIFAPDGARRLGGTGFHLRHGPREHGIAEIGMWIRGSDAGRGVGTAVLRALLHWGFTAWPWQRLVWRCHVDNVASARTAEKAGMTREGVQRRALFSRGALHDVIVYSALRDEWNGGT